MLEFIAGLGIGMVVGAAMSLAVMIYLKGQGYGLVSETPPATEGRVEGIAKTLDHTRKEVIALQDQSKRQEMRLDVLAQIIVEADLDKKGTAVPEGRPDDKPTGIVEAE